MGVGKFQDKEWRGAAMNWVIWLLSEMAIMVPLLMLFLGIAEWTTPTIEDVKEHAPPAYGFELLGNNSLFAEHVMSRNDTNVTSPTYGLWIPPDGE